MGFLTGLFSGFTLTAASVYISLTLHQQSRIRQASILRQQTLLLTSLVDPTVLSLHDDHALPRYRLEQGSWAERWKDRWNGEVEGAVRWVQGVRWRYVREGVEGRWREWNEGERRV